MNIFIYPDWDYCLFQIYRIEWYFIYIYTYIYIYIYIYLYYHGVSTAWTLFLSRTRMIVVFGDLLQALEANRASSTWKVSGELAISQLSVVRHFHDLGQSIRTCQIDTHVTKILQNFWLTLVFSVLYCCFFYRVWTLIADSIFSSDKRYA